MMEFCFTGSATLRGVTFFVEAETLEAAQLKARQGSHEGYDANAAETIDWQINPDTGTPNE